MSSCRCWTGTACSRPCAGILGLASLPFLFLTGLDAPENVRAGMRSGADDYLTKPVALGDLVDAVSVRLARREATRRESDRRLDDLRRSVTTLLPHELRTPLTALLGSLSLLQSSHREMAAADIDDLMGMAVRAANRLHRVAENYLLHAGLDFQRLADGTASTRPLAGTSGAADVEGAAQAVAAEADRTNDLQLSLSDVTAPIGGPYLRKIVSELVDNALKFSSRGQLVRVSLTQWRGEVRLEVADEGPGLTRAQVGEVGAFQQFGRNLLEQQGSGLGLALVRAMAVASGGSLEVVSSSSPAACIRVCWPLPRT